MLGATIHAAQHHCSTPFNTDFNITVDDVVGTVRSFDGQSYELTDATKEHTTRKGNVLTLLGWMTACRECGSAFTAWMVGIPTSYAKRRCDPCAIRYTIKLTPAQRKAANHAKNARRWARDKAAKANPTA